MQFNTFPTKEELGAAVAKHVLDRILATNKDKFVLGVPTGATPMPFLEAFLSLIKNLPAPQLNRTLEKLYFVAMDDFVDPSTRKNISEADERSAVGFLRRHLLDAFEKISPSANLTNRILFPKPGEVRNLKKKVIGMGGIDIQIIATDPYEGHVANNFPGQSLVKTEEEKCARLNDDFLRYHDWAAQYYGVTFGLDDFIDMVAANPKSQFLFMLWGEAKHATMQKFLDCKDYDPQLPVSFLRLASNKTFVFSDYPPAKKAS